MDSVTVKGKPLTKEETKALLQLIESSKMITTKTTNAASNKMKLDEWKNITHIFNATATSCLRTPQQLRLKWENLKKNARKRSTRIRMNHIQTGGGPADYIPPDDILDRVTGMLGSTASGFTVPFGGDKEVMGLDVGVMNGDGSISGDGDGTVDAKVSIESTQDIDMMPIFIDNSVETLVCNATHDNANLQNNDQKITPNKPKRFTLSTPRTVSKKFRSDDSRTLKNNAIAEYFSVKKQCLDERLKNFSLEKENLKLINNKLLLETEKLKVELEALKKQ